MTEETNAIIPATKAAAIVGARNAAIDTARRAAALIAEGHALAAQAAALARQAHDDAAFHEVDHGAREAFGRLFMSFDPTASVEAFRKHTDAKTWVRLIDLAGIRPLMDRTAKEEFYKELAGDVPSVTEDAIWATLEGLAGDARLIFQRGLARAFSDLDRRFKSHDGFKIGSRMILTRVFNEWGSWCYHNSARETLADVERVFAVLDGKRPDFSALEAAVNASRKGHGPQQGVCESTYFRIRTFQNGNAHLWFTRDDLVDKANQMLGEYYGAVLPDGVPLEPGVDAAFQSSSRAVSKDLAFYPTPPAVVEAALQGEHLGPEAVVLEPSAGTGNMVRVLLAKGARVTAVEVDPGRFRELDRLPAKPGQLRALQANFLQLPAYSNYTHVVMNPPFYGTHWIDHVVHAYDWLRPGGVLIAILPATAEVGDTKRHRDFREWAAQRSKYRHTHFRDLPPESFASSGTRVQTVVLTLYRERR